MSRNAVAFEAPEPFHYGAAPAGGYRFIVNDAGERIGATHGCPCGCGAANAFWFRGKAPARNPPSPEWDVAGDWPKVTMTPSLGFKVGDENGKTKPYHWHGFLRAGVFEEC